MAMTSPSGIWGACAARLYDPFLALGERRGMAARRRALLAGARGRVVEIGAGTGANLGAYPGAVDALVLTEPDPGMRRRLEQRVARSERPASVVAAGAEALPFADASFDTVVSTLVLCTVPDADAAVRELRRVMRPGGRLLFIEHVRADSPRLARRQDRLARPWRAFAAGCRCNRPTLDVLRAHFGLVAAEPAVWRGMPRIVHPLVAGHAEA
jgi:ubiquinone/menaquinone biosynthesis C-methylase UbiE